jgi:hypothetical protein
LRWAEKGLRFLDPGRGRANPPSPRTALDTGDDDGPKPRPLARSPLGAIDAWSPCVPKEGKGPPQWGGDFERGGMGRKKSFGNKRPNGALLTATPTQSQAPPREPCEQSNWPLGQCAGCRLLGASCAPKIAQRADPPVCNEINIALDLLSCG